MTREEVTDVMNMTCMKYDNILNAPRGHSIIGYHGWASNACS